MHTPALPLYSFFISLQQHPDFSLGIAEYECLLSVLEKQPDRYFNHHDTDRKQLLRLCELLWLKPNQNIQLFRKLFEKTHETTAQLLSKEIELLNELPTDTSDNSTTKPDSGDTKNNGGDTKPDGGDTKNDGGDTKSDTSKALPPLYLNFQEGQGDSINSQMSKGKQLLFIRNYVPFQWRQLIQVWRGLQNNKGKAKDTDEIDINASLKKLYEKGFLEQPIYRTCKQNQTALITLIDHKGSMVAFRQLAQTLADSAKKAGIDNHIYYFRNVPQRYNVPNEPEKCLLYVYADRGEIKHYSLLDILASQPNAAVLIISDAGASGGNYNMNRIEATETFLRELYKHTLKVAWLNPMPEDRWDGSSAYIIRELCDMFEATPNGLQKAMPILRGKKPPHSPIVFPELLNQL